MRDPRLLFLAYYFPPVNAVASVRTHSIAKWLTRNGWEVTVVTPRESFWRRPEAAEEIERSLAEAGIRCLRTDHRWLSLSPTVLRSKDELPARIAGGVFRRAVGMIGEEREIGWVREATRACAGLVPEDVDAILASGPPFAAFRVARRLAAKLNRPFVVDYRDLWTSDPYSARSPSPSTVEEEQAILRSCRAATVTTPGIAELLAGQFGLGEKIEVLTNGYDPEELVDVEPHRFDHFAIVYTGAFYPPKRAVTPLMAALRRLKARSGVQGREWAFHYYGDNSAHVRAEAHRFGVEDKVVIHGNVPRHESLSAVQGASVAVVITSVAPEGNLEDRGILTGKVFEAIGLGTPILGIGPRGSDLEKVLETSGLGRRFAGPDEEEITTFLEELMVRRIARPKDRDPYAWPNLARRLDAILRSALPATAVRSSAEVRR